MVEENALQRVLGYVDAAVAQGAVAVAGCSRALVETGGDSMGPPFSTGVSPDAVRRSRRSSARLHVGDPREGDVRRNRPDPAILKQSDVLWPPLA
ncbi:hypothetical protein M2275_007198 [Rhodococcus opacus]|nr:hypothetical protein [Rhodococcus opacus]